MSQPSIASYFNTRKRAAAEDVAAIKNKRLIEPSSNEPATSLVAPKTKQGYDVDILKSTVRTRSGRTIKRIGSQQDAVIEDHLPKKITKIEPALKQPKLVRFIKKGTLSPHKKRTTVTLQTKEEPQLEDEQQSNNTNSTVVAAFASKNNAANIERGMRTPTKQIIKGSGATPIKHGAGEQQLKSLVKKELNFDEVKTKITRSAKLQELKASLHRIQELEKTRKQQEERNRRLRDGNGDSGAGQKAPVVQLKEFDKIEVEILTSPAKVFKTPTKLPPPTPDKNELMSPRHTNVAKRVLFSPSKNGSPSKMIVPPAYQRFMNLAETSTAGKLPLPFKYRHLIEIFKGVDSVCAMFHNRKECITFKKLKPAVQRMLRKNFTENHLAQIKHLYPEAFIFSQMKMRNFGSLSKADYFQLIIAPNVEDSADAQKANADDNGNNDDDNVLAAAQTTSMNPHIMIERLKRITNLLLERVMDEHDKFLKSLNPPLLIAKEKVTRWHPEFDLEDCPDIELAHLPQPPNVDKYSSARDILSTARNLFNCATPLERAMERYEAKMETEKKCELTTSTVKPAQSEIINTQQSINNTLLKGVPKTLLEKIRAKQAAKALDAMTRRPSQDEEATMYSRLPELARHLRNVFITEKKGVLTQETVIKKIQNSFRTSLTPYEIEAHLKLLAKESPTWASFHEVRKTMYLKISREMDLSKVVERLEALANEKSK